MSDLAAMNSDVGQQLLQPAQDELAAVQQAFRDLASQVSGRPSTIYLYVYDLFIS